MKPAAAFAAPSRTSGPVIGVGAGDGTGLGTSTGPGTRVGTASTVGAGAVMLLTTSTPAVTAAAAPRAPAAMNHGRRAAREDAGSLCLWISIRRSARAAARFSSSPSIAGLVC